VEIKLQHEFQRVQTILKPKHSGKNIRDNKEAWLRKKRNENLNSRQNYFKKCYLKKRTDHVFMMV
jgi:hypothetical protein